MTDLVVALDVATEVEALKWVDRLSFARPVFKVGLELFAAAGPSVVRAMRSNGQRVFLDLKLHDIPNTVARTVSVAADLGVEFLTLHAAGGRAMWQAATRARGDSPMKLLGVTVLTSFDDAGWLEVVGDSKGIEGTVSRWAQNVRDWGADGTVSSARELAILPRGPQSGYRMVPGIRLAGDSKGDQARVVTPQEAIHAGANGIVMGRSILGAKDPEAVVRDLNQLFGQPLGQK